MLRVSSHRKKVIFSSIFAIKKDMCIICENGRIGGKWDFTPPSTPSWNDYNDLQKWKLPNIPKEVYIFSVFSYCLPYKCNQGMLWRHLFKGNDLCNQWLPNSHELLIKEWWSWGIAYLGLSKYVPWLYQC